MTLWQSLKRKLTEFEEENKEKWFIYRNKILKFNCVVFDIRGEAKIKFDVFDFTRSSNSIGSEYIHIDIENMNDIVGVSQDFIDEQIKIHALFKLSSP